MPLTAVKRLQVFLISRKAVPEGGGFKDGLTFLLSRERMAAAVAEVGEEMAAMFRAVRSTADGASMSDEEIAERLMARIDEVKQQ